MTPTLSPQKKTAVWLVAVACTMLGLSFAAVPFYDWFCRVTGFGGTTMKVSEEAAANIAVTNKPITIRFDSNVSSALPRRCSRSTAPPSTGRLEAPWHEQDQGPCR